MILPAYMGIDTLGSRCKCKIRLGLNADICRVNLTGINRRGYAIVTQQSWVLTQETHICYTPVTQQCLFLIFKKEGKKW